MGIALVLTDPAAQKAAHEPILRTARQIAAGRTISEKVQTYWRFGKRMRSRAATILGVKNIDGFLEEISPISGNLYLLSKDNVLFVILIFGNLIQKCYLLKEIDL